VNVKTYFEKLETCSNKATNKGVKLVSYDRMGRACVSQGVRDPSVEALWYRRNCTLINIVVPGTRVSYLITGVLCRRIWWRLQGNVLPRSSLLLDPRIQQHHHKKG